MAFRCPICGVETAWVGNPTRPFCSEACQMRDLGNWLTERYSVPVSEPDAVPDPADAPRETDAS